MIRTRRAREPVLGERPIAGLEVFLERRLVIVARQAVPVNVVDERRELARDERANVLDPAVEVDRRDQRFVAVGEERLLSAAAGFLFATAEQQVVAD